MSKCGWVSDHQFPDFSKQLWYISPDATTGDHIHYTDVIMGAMASQITSLPIVYSTVYSGADQR